MRIRLDHSSGEPIYRQVVEQVKFAVAAGQVAPGGQLPSIRALAAELKINPRTVVKAYDELAHAGLVVLRHGQGAFVADRSSAAPRAVRRKVITDLARRLLSEASRMGADADEVGEILRDVAEEMETKR